MELAAYAALHGIDPARVLEAEGADYQVMAALVQRAATLEGERRRSDYEGLAQLIGNRVGEVVARAIGG